MSLRRSLLLALNIAALPVAAGTALAAEDSIEILRSTGEEVVFRVAVPAPRISADPGSGDVIVEIAEWGSVGEIGGPELPQRTVLIGIPSGSAPSVEVLSARTRFQAGAVPRPRPQQEIVRDEADMPIQSEAYVRQPALYAAPFPPAMARLERTAQLRHLPVAAVSIQPVRWDPDRQGIWIAEEIEVRVRFPGSEGERREGALVPREADHWNRRYERSVLNWDQARSFLRLAPRAEASSRVRRGGDGPEFRIEVEATDLYRVPFETLVGAGWDLGAVPVDRIAMEERFWNESEATLEAEPVPIWIRDNDSDGQFGAGDDVIFHGLTIWERKELPPWDRRYGRKNAYWLTVRDEGGARMDVRPSTLGRSDLVSESAFSWRERFEEDLIYMGITVDGESASPIEGSVENLRDDHYYWFGVDNLGLTKVDFDLPGFVAAESLEVRLRDTFILPGFTQPIFTLRTGANESVATSFPDLTVPTEKGSVVYRWGGEAVSGIQLAERGNDFIINHATPNFGAAIDYFTWTYRRSTRALADELAFDTDALAGVRQWDLGGFGGTDIVLFEVTVPSAPVRLSIDPAQISGSGSNRTARVQLDLGGGGTERRFLARRAARIPLPPRVERAGDTDLSAPRNTEAIAIAHPDFLDGMEAWVDHRTAQGVSVELVSLRDVYDQFGGGREWPSAIRNYLRFLFRTREAPPASLLLVGDASADFAQVLARSDVNYVPTQTVLSNARSTDGSELVATDHYFVDDLVGTGNRFDLFADMAVGRLPVGNQAELTAMVSKILAYDEFRDNEVWRNRGLFASDDEFSSRVDFDSDYRFRGDSNRQWPSQQESVFRYAGREGTRKIREGGFLDFGVDSFYVAAYLDTVACLQRCIPIENPLPPDCRDWSCRTVNGEIADINPAAEPNMWTTTWTYATETAVIQDTLITKMSRGQLFVMLQSHANRAQAGHEYFYMDSNGNGRFDSDRMENVGKPFLFFGFGCHMAEFAHPEETFFTRGDCLVERLLFEDEGRGAVAGLASTAYEWLRENAYPQIPFLDSWFVRAPRDPDGRSRWLLGDLIGDGMVNMITNYGNFDRRAMIPTYVLLGDPTMTIDLAPPRADRVEVNGAPWTPGDPLRAPLGSDEAEIEIAFRDEVHLETIELFSAGTEVDPSGYEVLPDPERPDADGRALVRYRPALDVPLQDYTILVRAGDRAGRFREVSFPVRLAVTFEVWRDGAYRPLEPESFLELGDSLRVQLATPVAIERTAIELLVDGIPLDGEILPATPEAVEDWSWRVLAEVTTLSAGRFDVTLRVARGEGEDPATRSVPVRTVSEDVSLGLVYNFPNPFDDQTGFYYELDGPVESARISVFTLSGRKIWEGTGSVRAGGTESQPRLVWDGRDLDGDPVANGVYFYKLVIRTLQGEELTRIERIARVR